MGGTCGRYVTLYSKPKMLSNRKFANNKKIISMFYGVKRSLKAFYSSLYINFLQKILILNFKTAYLCYQAPHEAILPDMCISYINQYQSRKRHVSPKCPKNAESLYIVIQTSWVHWENWSFSLNHFAMRS